MTNDINKFFGYGDGYGNGRGDGYGNGRGYGDGNGDGNGDGGLESMNKVGGHCIYNVDGLHTAIFAIFGNYAKAGVLQDDMTFRPCFVARVGNSFAHGKTLKEARKDAESKELSNLPLEKRVEMFLAAHPDPKAKIHAKQLFEWHHILTGSCLLGRQQFCKDHGIDIERDKFTIYDFVKLTINSYGGEIIKNLAKKLSYGTISKLRDTVGELNRDKVAKARELDGLYGELEKARNNAPKCEQRAKKTQGNGKAGAAKNGAAKRKAAHAE